MNSCSLLTVWSGKIVAYQSTAVSPSLAHQCKSMYVQIRPGPLHISPILYLIISDGCPSSPGMRLETLNIGRQWYEVRLLLVAHVVWWEGVISAIAYYIAPRRQIRNQPAHRRILEWGYNIEVIAIISQTEFNEVTKLWDLWDSKGQCSPCHAPVWEIWGFMFMKLIATHILIFCIEVVVMVHRGKDGMLFLFIFKEWQKCALKNILT